MTVGAWSRGGLRGIHLRSKTGAVSLRLRWETKFGLRADAREAIVADPVCMKTTHISQVAAPIMVEGLTKRYGSVKAVDDLSFAVRAGAVTGFLGPNGAGKTTALKMIVGLARPTAGRALVNGSPVASVAADAEHARRLHRALRRPSGSFGA